MKEKYIIMYRGYSISKKEIESFFRYINRQNGGQIDYINNFTQKKIVQEWMDNTFLGMGGEILDAEKIQADWFPEIDAHVFISHSHADIKLAKNFAGWLYQKFGIVSFIDSCVWGYANDLLRKLDDKYCKDELNNCYDYDQRNLSTANVHMILMIALSKMIEKSECVFFLNTPNSNIGDAIKSITLSPWIYGEIEVSRIIKKKVPIRRYSQGGILDENFQMGYPLNLDHLYPLNSNDLMNWGTNTITSVGLKKPLGALDELYKITPKKEII